MQALPTHVAECKRANFHCVYCLHLRIQHYSTFNFGSIKIKGNYICTVEIADELHHDKQYYGYCSHQGVDDTVCIEDTRGEEQLYGTIVDMGAHITSLRRSIWVGWCPFLVHVYLGATSYT